MQFEARMPDTREVDLEAPPWGIVPISPRTSGEVVLEAEWRPARKGEGAPVRRRVVLSAASRSHGLTNVAVDEGVLLAAPSWSVAGAPPGAIAVAKPIGGMSRLVPDVSGDWVLRDENGRSLAIRAGRYDETPLDCGRSRCHVAITDSAESSPMTLALLRRMTSEDIVHDGHFAGADAVTCALPCHATGEPGARDGGFVDVARELGIFPSDDAWATLPRALRRLGGVTCLACHGPGAIPEPGARWATLRADVCATCHDAPPVYGHVAAWRTSRMARSDSDPHTRPAECARCHSTAGFVASLSENETDRLPPADVGPVGVACAACHAPHEEHKGAGARSSALGLLRAVPLPTSLEGVPIEAPSAICMPCHAPAFAARPLDGPLRLPSASAAAIWAGRAGVDPETGAPLAGTPVHGGVERSCLGCHAGGPRTFERGSGHAFAVDRAVCRACHPGGVPDSDSRLQEEARDLLSRLRGPTKASSPTTNGPPHVMPSSLPADRRGRAIYDLTLVLEDPAAASHNAPFARALLDAARKVAESRPGGIR
jgi:hypothetical protein